MRAFLGVLVLVIIVAAAAYVWAGRRPGPAIDTSGVPAIIGRDAALRIKIATPRGDLRALDVTLRQGDTVTPLFSLSGDTAALSQSGPDELTLSRPVGKTALPDLAEGKATIAVSAARPVLFGWRTVGSSASVECDVRLTPPRVEGLSTFHFINHGGSELVVYRVTPPDASSGVRVGDTEYPGYDATGAGVPDTTTGLKVAFFALLHDQDVATPISLFARDAAGNEGRAAFDVRVFPKPFRRSRIEVDDAFLARVVPAIAEQSPALKLRDPGDLVGSYLQINDELRRLNDGFIATLGTKTASQKLWDGPFRQLANSQVEASFADHRTYFYKSKEIDQQVHLGFDLAVTAGVDVLAANAGRVVWADYLGIYGNCVIVDHGLGVQSLYGHLSSIGVKPGDGVARSQSLGRSGMTGLAGGDHLHFTMLVAGHAVTPVDWWSAQWIEDRIYRKLRDAGAEIPSPQRPSTAAPRARRRGGR